MDNEDKSGGIKPIIVIAPIVVTGAVVVQLLTGTIITKGRFTSITRAETPVLYWLCMAGEIAVAAFLWLAILRSRRSD